MPAWLKDPAPAPGAGWKHAVALWGGSLVALAVVFGGAMWLFDQHNADSTKVVAAPNATPPVVPAAVSVVPERRESTLPPLVLLAPAPATPAALAEVPPPAVAELAPKVIAERTVAKAAPKPAPQPEHKVALVKPAAVQARPKARLALAPKAKPRALAGITLPPAREPRIAAEPPRENAPSKCQRGELARECAARNGSY